MTQRLCATEGCARYSSEEVCTRCRSKQPAAAVPDTRNLLKCTVCGYEAANRGILALHVGREHGDGEGE